MLPLLTMTACPAPTVWANRASKAATWGPIVVWPIRRQASTASISSSP